MYIQHRPLVCICYKYSGLNSHSQYLTLHIVSNHYEKVDNKTEGTWFIYSLLLISNHNLVRLFHNFDRPTDHKSSDVKYPMNQNVTNQHIDIFLLCSIISDTVDKASNSVEVDSYQFNNDFLSTIQQLG